MFCGHKGTYLFGVNDSNFGKIGYPTAERGINKRGIGNERGDAPQTKQDGRRRGMFRAKSHILQGEFYDADNNMCPLSRLQDEQKAILWRILR